MITLNYDQGLVRLKTWEEVKEHPGFVEKLDPKKIKLKSIIGVYALNSKNKCGLKNCRQPHQKGYLVTTDKGAVTNIGNICGISNFSVEFKSLRKTFNRDLAEKEWRERLESLKFRLPEFNAKLAEVKKFASPLHAAISKLIGNIGNFPREVTDKVKQARRTGDAVLSDYRKANKQEQAIAIETGLIKPGQQHYIQYEIGKLDSIGALSDKNNIRTLLRPLEEALNMLDGSSIDNLTYKQLQHLNKETTGIDSKLEMIEQAFYLAKKFLRRENISQLSKLIEKNKDKSSFNTFLNTLSV